MTKGFPPYLFSVCIIMLVGGSKIFNKDVEKWLHLKLNFQKQRQVTDILTVDVKKIVLSDRVGCNNAIDWSYIIGCQGCLSRQ